MRHSHSMPFGAELGEDGTVRFRLWAPSAQVVELCCGNHCLPLASQESGWFELVTREAVPGSRYHFRIDGETAVPDPASRFQPCDVHGPSEVVDPRAFDWHDEDWRGRPWQEAVIYELHVGTFTPEGTFRALEQRLDYLRDLGVTAVELMPVADFPGTRNWGYDGVLPFAPDSSYGGPESLKHLIQTAHEKGLMVLLDVVYNHFGPDGNYLGAYSPQFFTSRHRTPWGEAVNFDGPDSGVVRHFFIHNALYWLEEYRLDGLRLDAVHAIVDESTPDIVTELAEVVRQRFASNRLVHLVLENADNAAHYLRREAEGSGQLYDAQWNDDIHHCLHVLITGESDGYYSDYARTPSRQLCRCLAEGFAYQGEYSEFHAAHRGEPTTGLPPSAFISFLQNHDQIGNRAFGERILKLGPPRRLKTALEVMLLAPQPPLLFMGEEFGATSPFLFFCDFKGDLAAAVTSGRRDEFSGFERFNSASDRNQIPDPNEEKTFLASKLDWDALASESHQCWFNFYHQLLSIRRRTVVPHLSGPIESHVRGWGSEDSYISIDWMFEDGALLELRANLSDRWMTEGIQFSGRPFYRSDNGAASSPDSNSFPPWSTIWCLKQ